MKKIISLFAFLTLTYFASAQSCGSCTVNISGYDTLAYTVNSGQTFCVDTTGNFQGILILNGGTVCNKGYFNPHSFTFNTGTIDNYGNSTLETSITLSSNKVINNKPDAVTNLSGGLTLSGGAFTNNGITNISQNITNTSGTINNTGILNCVQLTGSNSVTNTGVINTN